MSMLTPPGMGGKYRITGDKYPRMRPRRRRGRVAAAVVASVAAVGLVGWGTLQLIDVFAGGGKKASAAGSADCASSKASPSAGTASGTASGTAAGTKAALPKPGQIKVNVYNATTRSLLAKHTAEQLQKRGFKIGNVGNASTQFDKKVKGTGILLGPPASLNSSLPVLATQLGAAERRTDAARKGTDVDLILGNGFKALTDEAAADKALAALAHPQPTPSSKKGC